MKTCNKCGKNKESSEFYNRKASKDGLAAHCKLCNSIICKKYYVENKNVIIKRSSVWKIENPVKAQITFDNYRIKNAVNISIRKKLYREANKDKFRVLSREYSQKYSADFKHRNSKRKAIKINATPKWANFKSIRDIYRYAEALSLLEGVEYHVDHIVPLRSKIVCGLHWEENLQVITATENNSKGNRWWPDMP